MHNRVAFVTGASRGIGKACALALADSGARVALAARQKEKLEAVAAEIRSRSRESYVVDLDLASDESIKNAFALTAKEFGRVDILVNNAGITRDNLALRMKKDDWSAVLETNLTGAFRAIQQVLQGMMRERWGRIINLGAVGAERAFGQAKISAYAAAKAGVVALSRSLALEEAKNGITVNVVNPSSIDENELTLNEARRIRDARFPIGRPPTVEDVAASVAFFASEEAEYVTGQVVNVSGGWML